MDEREIREAVALHVARNRELAEFLRLNGADAGSLRDLNVFFCARDEHRARRLGRALLQRDVTDVLVRPPEGLEDAWAVEGHVSMSIAAISADSFTDSLVRLAAAFDADYHGWDAASEPLVC